MYKVEAKTKTSSGVELTTNSSSNHDTKKFTGSLETKYKWPDYGKSNCYSARHKNCERLILNCTAFFVSDPTVKGCELLPDQYSSRMLLLSAVFFPTLAEMNNLLTKFITGT